MGTRRIIINEFKYQGMHVTVFKHINVLDSHFSYHAICPKDPKGAEWTGGLGDRYIHRELEDDIRRSLRWIMRRVVAEIEHERKA